MKHVFPQQQGESLSAGYTQINRGDGIGSLWSTFNIDLQNNLGTLQSSPRMMVRTSTDQQANFGRPSAIKFFDNRYFTIAGSRIFRNTGYNPASAFSEDTSTGVQTDYQFDESDLEIFNDKLWASGNGDLYFKDANGSGTGAWTLHTTSPSGYNMMCNFTLRKRLYLITNSNLIRSTDGTNYSTTAYQLEIPYWLPSCICSTSTQLWIGTVNVEDEIAQATIYTWDGLSPQFSQTYKINAPGICAMVVYNDIPYAMDVFGIFHKFTGYSFKEIGRLPFADYLMDDNVQGFSQNPTNFIHPRGLIATKNGTFLALVSNATDTNAQTAPENAPSGIYEFSEEFGWTHKTSLTYNITNSSTISDYGQNRIGTIAIDSFVGGLAQAWTPDSGSTRNGMIICGSQFVTNATVVNSAIFVDDSNNTKIKKSYFVTTWIKSKDIQDKWLRLWSVFKRFVTSTDFVVWKYRIYEENPIIATITWTSGNTFTTTTDISAYIPTATGFDGVTGGEVEIIQGTGGGACVHITNAVLSTGTWTVTIDETLPNVTSTAIARFQKWIKLFPVVTGQQKSWEQLAIGVSNPRIQIKCCMTLTDQGTNRNEFEKFVLVSNEDIKSNP